MTEVLARIPHAPLCPCRECNPNRLTPREQELLDCWRAGLSNYEIADRWVVSYVTVRSHAARILGKLGVHSIAQAVAWSYRIEAGELRDDFLE